MPLTCALRAALTILQVQPSVGDGQAGELWCDFAFVIQGEHIPLHRAVLAARSPFLRRRLLSQWLPKVSCHDCNPAEGCGPVQQFSPHICMYIGNIKLSLCILLLPAEAPAQQMAYPRKDAHESVLAGPLTFTTHAGNTSLTSE